MITRFIRAGIIAAIIIAVYLTFMSVYYGIESVIRGGSFFFAPVKYPPLIILTLDIAAFVLGWLISGVKTNKKNVVKKLDNSH